MTTDFESAQTLRELAGDFTPSAAIVLGSGWSTLTQHLQNATRIPYQKLLDFPSAGVAGHAGELWLGHLGSTPVAVMSGRKHTYETGDAGGMKMPLRALRALGCEVLVQTNAAGSLKKSLPPGSLMVVSDHLNLAQRSPLIGETGSQRFVDMGQAYDTTLRRHALNVLQSRGITASEGVYAWMLGPQFETPAEIRMCALLGADAVGMSTVPETIIARHAGMKVLAISMMTNMGAGLSDETLSHAHTLAQAQAVGERAAEAIARIVADLPLPVAAA
ncbi:MAG: purine-nucleoside phosphorylase [Ramlibacter sp.]|nr:purine-nucleoside phosphorylase [Ramlibacter sp.]